MNTLAQDLDAIQTGAMPDFNPDLKTPASVIDEILPYVFGAAALALLIYLLLGGFQYMFSRGDPKAAQSAQAKITNAVIGFVIVILAFLIVQLFGTVLGLQNTLFGQIFGTK